MDKLQGRVRDRGQHVDEKIFTRHNKFLHGQDFFKKKKKLRYRLIGIPI